MSSQTDARFSLQRENARLLAVARRVLDPRALSTWINAGRAGGLEAGRLLAASSAEGIENLRAELEQRRREPLAIDDLKLTVPSVDPGESSGVLAIDDLDLAVPSVDLAVPSLAFTVPAVEPVELAGVLASEQRVLTAVVTESLALEGFALDTVDISSGIIAVLGRHDEQLVSVKIDPSAANVVVDVGVPGFASSAECEHARDAIVERLLEHGILVDQAGRPHTSSVREREITTAVERAVGEALPGYEIRTQLEGDELQVIALPQTEPDEGGSA